MESLEAWKTRDVTQRSTCCFHMPLHWGRWERALRSSSRGYVNWISAVKISLVRIGNGTKKFPKATSFRKKTKKITYRYWNELLIAHHVKEFLEQFQRILMMGGNTIYLVYDLIASLTLCIAMSLNLLGAKIRCSCFLLPLPLLPLLLLLLIIYCYLVSVLFGMTMYSIISYLISVRCNWTTLAS